MGLTAISPSLWLVFNLTLVGTLPMLWMLR